MEDEESERRFMEQIELFNHSSHLFKFLFNSSENNETLEVKMFLK